MEAAFASGLRETFWVSGAMGLAGALIFLVLFRTTAAQPPADRRGPAGAGAAAGVGEPAAGAAERAAV